MADKLDTLLAAVQQEIKDKKAELLALQSQVSALRSAHDDLHKQVGREHANLQSVRDKLAIADSDTDQRKKEAEKVASEILNRAHRSRDEADKLVKDAEDHADEIMATAQKAVRKVEEEIVARKKELQAVTLEVNAAHSEWAAIKKKAAALAGS